MVSLFSCEKDQVVSPQPVDQNIVSTTSIDGILGLRNGHLVFEDLDAYQATLQELSTLSVAEKLAWNKALGFNSVASQKEALTDKYEQVSSEAELAAVIEEIEATGYFHFEDGFISSELFGSINWLIDRDHRFYLGEKLYKKTAERLFVVMDGDPVLLELAEQRPLTDEAKGIYVFDHPRLGTGGRGPRCSEEHQAKFDKKRLRYQWRLDFMIEPVNVNGTVLLRNTYNYDAEMESRKKSFLIWKRTWIDVRFSFETDEFSSSLVDCTPFNPSGSACAPAVNFPTNINITENRQDVADAEVTRQLLQFTTTCACPISEIDFIQLGDYRSYVDRTDDSYPINTAGLHVVITCGSYN